MSIRLAYLNGHFLDADQAKLSPWDAGFVWGATVTDRCRTYGRRFFRLPEHLARFRRSAELCRISQPIPDAELTLFADHLLAVNGPVTPPEAEFELVLFATPGEAVPNLGMFVESFRPTRFEPILTRGARLMIPTTRQLPGDCVPPQAKMRSRLHWWIAEQEVKAIDPGASALLLDHAGHVTETAFANFLIVRDGIVISPPSASILPGVSLAVIRDLCESLGVPLEEHPLTPADCLAADEALVTSTPFGVAGVSQLNGRPIPWPGKMLRRLVDAWTQQEGKSPHAGIVARSE